VNVEITHATIAKLELGPDDVVVVRIDINLSPGRVQQIGSTIKEAVGDHKVLVVAPNMSIEVIEKGPRP
jgi:hypothetical protein